MTAKVEARSQANQQPLVLRYQTQDLHHVHVTFSMDGLQPHLVEVRLLSPMHMVEMQTSLFMLSGLRAHTG